MSTQIEDKTDVNVRKMPMYKVLIHNDDVNTMDHVVLSLVHVFGFSAEEAVGIMVEAHNSGCALAKVEPKEPAEFHCEQLLSLSITSTIEPED
jgi:ATP-dependent Clp protease adaptor protein ClpS